MAVFAALGKTLQNNVVSTIYSFLDESSMATCGSGARDLADLNDAELSGVPEINHYWSTQLLDLDRSRICWHFNDLGAQFGF